MVETSDRTDDTDERESSGRSIRSAPGRPWLIAGAAVASVASVWSLSLSLVFGLVPCELCWYQRICMYSLPLVLGVGAYDGRPAVYRTVLPLSLVGGIVAGYHSWLQLAPGGTCSIGGCSAIQYTFLGLSTPNLAFIAFSLIITTAIGAHR